MVKSKLYSPSCIYVSLIESILSLTERILFFPALDLVYTIRNDLLKYVNTSGKNLSNKTFKYQHYFCLCNHETLGPVIKLKITNISLHYNIENVN